MGDLSLNSISVELLENLVNLDVYDKLLDNKLLEILNILLDHSHLTAFSLQKIRSNRYKHYSGSQRGLTKLLELNLIEVAKEEYTPIEKNKGKDPKPYRLSLNGIFSVILNNFSGLYEDLVIQLLKNHGSNILFTLFVYPYISQNTLLEIKENNIFYEVYRYLNNTCITIINSLKSLANLVYTVDNDGYLLDRLFMWPNKATFSPPILFEDKELRNFLKTHYNWEWICHSRITPDYKQNVIDIFKPNEPEEIIRLSIDEKDNTAILTINNKKLDEFIVTRYDLFLSMDIKTKERRIEYFTKFLISRCNNHLIGFIINIRNQINSNSQTYVRLLRDEKFVKVIDYVDNLIKKV